MRLAICKNDKIFNHSGSWATTWIDFCQKTGLNYEIVDCYQPDIVEKLRGFDCLVWHINNYVLQDMMFARSILYTASNMGLKTFPDYKTSWHFDDKVAESYLLQSIGAPMPKAWTFFLQEDCMYWLKNKAQFPLVAKLRCGAGSNNVKLLKSSSEAIRYTRHIFHEGLNTSPNILFKTKSQIKSSANWQVVKSRLKRIPDFLQTLSRAKMFPREKGYAYFQEFIPNDGYDLKIVVIGDKLSFICRKIRKGDFRASGGGDLFFERELVTKDIISTAFDINDKLGFQCMGYDYVVDKKTGLGKIVEISYGFSHTALLQAGGYFDRNGVWHDVPLNAPEEVLKILVETAGKQ